MATKLPILETTFYSYRLTINGWLYALKISWFWLALIYSGYALFVPLFLLLDIANILLFDFVMLLLFTISWTSIIVLWHRHILLKECRKNIPVQINIRASFYFFRFVLIWIIILLVSFPLLFLLPIPPLFSIQSSVDDQAIVDWLESMSSAFMVILPIFTLIFGLIFGRFGIALPAIALDFRSFGLIAAWKKTSGNSLRIIIIMALTTWPLLLLVQLISETYSYVVLLAPFTPIGEILASGLLAACHLLAVLVGVTFLSISYGYLVERRPLSSLS